MTDTGATLTPQPGQSITPPPPPPATVVADTGTGFLTGGDPAVPPAQQVPAPTVTPQTVLGPVLGPVPGQTFYTAEDIARARAEEAAQLRTQLDQQGQQLQTLATEREQRLAAEEAARVAEAEAKRAREMAEMDANTRMETLLAETNQRVADIERQRDVAIALQAKEQELHELQAYGRALVEQNPSAIAPQLRDLISGNTREEVEASFQDLAARSQALFEDMVQASQGQQLLQQPAPPLGVPYATAPPVGPMEQAPGSQSLTAADIANMSAEEYARNRDQLRGAAVRSYYNG